MQNLYIRAEHKTQTIFIARILDEVRKELGLPKLSIQESYNSTITTQTNCPPGWQTMTTPGVCKRENYWNLPTTPPNWFAERILYYGDGNPRRYVRLLIR
ncbi:MAG: hypothetical protein ACK416_03145 [Zestosphaera sp.]